jgi:hypothetical protein
MEVCSLRIGPPIVISYALSLTLLEREIHREDLTWPVFSPHTYLEER